MISIVSDTSTMYTPLQGKEKGITIVPLHVSVNNSSYRDMEDITSDQLLKMIEEKHIPRTSQPSLGEKIDAYNELSEKGEVLDITMSSGLSGTYQTALLAKDECNHPERIHVFDSQTLCGPHRQMVDTALNLVNEGYSIKDVILNLETMREHELSYLVPFDFGFLVRGGRLNGVAGALGGLLKLIPVMKKGEHGKGLDKFAVCRTLKKVHASILEDMKKEGVDASYRFSVSHAANLELAENAVLKIHEAFPGAIVEIFELTPSFITQGGPGCVAVQAVRV